MFGERSPPSADIAKQHDNLTERKIGTAVSFLAFVKDAPNFSLWNFDDARLPYIWSCERRSPWNPNAKVWKIDEACWSEKRDTSSILRIIWLFCFRQAFLKNFDFLHKLFTMYLTESGGFIVFFRPW